MKDQVIAIDGPSASGKSTLAKVLAAALHIPCVNTGSMFRATALAAQKRSIAWDDEEALARMLDSLDMQYNLNAGGEFELSLDGQFPGEALRTAEIAAGASAVAKLPKVREALKIAQRKMAGHGYLVMEGRDIGTVIFPNAEFKFFVTASPMERARRRLAQEGSAAGESIEAVAASIAARDLQDSQRAVAPLRPAEDAEIIDNSGLTREATFELIYGKVKNAVRG